MTHHPIPTPTPTPTTTTPLPQTSSPRLDPPTTINLQWPTTTSTPLDDPKYNLPPHTTLGSPVTPPGGLTIDGVIFGGFGGNVIMDGRDNEVDISGNGSGSRGKVEKARLARRRRVRLRRMRRKGLGGGSGGNGGEGVVGVVDKRARRIIRNREVALKARQAAKERMRRLEGENGVLRGKARDLQKENGDLKWRIEVLKRSLNGGEHVEVTRGMVEEAWRKVNGQGLALGLDMGGAIELITDANE